MNALFDRYNLNAFERRVIVGIGLVIFLAVNVLFVWPKFSEWGELHAQKESAQRKLRLYQATLDKRSKLEKRLAELENSGADIIPENMQENQLISIIQQKALESKFPPANIRPVANTFRSEEKFFEQKGFQISRVKTNMERLIAFLIAIGSDNNSMIRVRDLAITPEKHHLSCDISFIANYQMQPSATSGVQREK